jgi:hypothetical protein
MLKITPNDNSSQETTYMTQSEYEEHVIQMAHDWECSEDEVRESYDVEEFKNPSDCNSLDELYEALVAIASEGNDLEQIMNVDYSELPTFGDYDGDTSDIYSWDDTRFLTGANGWQLVDRE